MRISDWSSDVCSSDLRGLESERIEQHREIARANGERIIAEPRIALDAITHSQATFTNRDLAMFVHRHSDGKEQYDRPISAVRSSPDLITLGTAGRGEDRFTSRELIDTDKRLHTSTALKATITNQPPHARARICERAHAPPLRKGSICPGDKRGAFIARPDHPRQGRTRRGAVHVARHDRDRTAVATRQRVDGDKRPTSRARGRAKGRAGAGGGARAGSDG